MLQNPETTARPLVSSSNASFNGLTAIEIFSVKIYFYELKLEQCPEAFFMEKQCTNKNVDYVLSVVTLTK